MLAEAAVRHMQHQHMPRVLHTLVAEARLALPELEFMHPQLPHRINLQLHRRINPQAAHTSLRRSIARRHSVNRTLANRPESLRLRQSRLIRTLADNPVSSYLRQSRPVPQ